VNRLRRQDSIRDNLRAAPARGRRAVASLFARPHPDPIFILGHQKSGTSAVAALLGELTGCSVTIDLLNEDRWPTYPRVRSGELRFDRFVRRNRLDFSRRIVKEPNLTFFHPQLRARFPTGTFAMVVRDPRTTIKSVLDRIGLPGDRLEVPRERERRLRRGWRLMLDPEWLGIEAEGYVDLLARRWNICADVYLERSEPMPLLRYEDFRIDKLGALTSLAGELGLDPRGDIRDRLDEQFQPAGDRSVAVESFFGAANLERIERVCGSRMEQLGYGAFLRDEPR
jgi:hypothetical protein